MKKHIWVLYVDSHNGSTDFYAYASEKSAQKGFLAAFNAVFDRKYKLYWSAANEYDTISASGTNEDWLRLEKIELQK
jgi:hypothetical protein